jgi:hypothetical protein
MTKYRRTQRFESPKSGGKVPVKFAYNDLEELG